MLDPTIEQLIPLQRVAKVKWLPKRPHIATVFRWAQRGLNGIKLETLQVGNTKCTSEQALRRFFDQLTSPTQASAATPRLQQRAHDEAERQLMEAGF